MKREYLVIFSLLLSAASGEAQVTTGTILGTVTDSTGGAVAGAQVTVTNVNRGTRQQYPTDQTGTYTAPFLVPGMYRVEVEKEGFKRATSVDTQLDVDQKARIDFSMQLGQLSESITVEAAAPLVRSETAELGEVVNQHSVEALPLNGRNFAQLVYLVPGVTQGQAGENLSGASTFNPRAASDFNSLGSQANANAWLVDGIMDNEYTFNTVMVQPSVESVQEFKVLTGTYSAEFGRGAGVVTTQTRSGSNAFHGSAFEFLRNSYLDARSYFNAVGQAQTPYRRNQFGGSLGGPIWKNKTFFFGDYYGWREVKGQTFINTVPTAQDRLGNFSDLPVTIYDPYSTALVNGKRVRTPYLNNTIPANELNSVGLNVASIYPLPNLPGFQNNRVDTLSRNLDDNGGNLRIDHKFNEKDSLFGRYSFEQFNLFDTKGQGGCCIPTPASAASQFDLGPFIAGGQNTVLAASGFAFNETHIFSPSVVNEFIAGYARTNPLTRQSDYGHDAATSLGIQGINISTFTTGIPTMNISGVPGFSSYTSLNGGPSFLPANPRQTSYQLQDDISFVRSSHNLKVGYRIIKDLVSPFTNTNTRGALNFGLNFTDNPVDASGGNGLADLLLGFLANGTSAGGSRGFLQTPYYLTTWEHAAFVQDDWKVTRRLTLNLGLRWDLFTPYTEQRNRLTNFDLSNLTLVYAGVSGTSRAVGVQTRWNNFSPHFGFAWDVSGDGKTVLRGGFSSSYFPEQPSGSNFLGRAVPWTISQNTPTTELYPLGPAMSSVPKVNNPFGPPIPVQPMDTAQLIAANPSILGGSFTNQTPYYESWSFNVERQLGSSMLTELAYAGSHGVHLLYCYNPQEVEPGPSSIPSNLRVTIPAIATLRTINQCDPRNMSNYHGMQAKLVKRLSFGLSFLASYTWSKSLDYGGSAASGGGAVGNPQTITDLRAGYGASGFDIPQRFVGSWTSELPFGPGRRFLTHGLLGNLIGGWELDGISTLQSGLPFTVYLANCTNNATSCWPDRLASGSLSNPTYSHWYDPSAFEAPCAVATQNGACSQYAYRFGDSGRGILRAPGTFNFDLAAAKNFAIKERFKVQFRLDPFNALNHPQLGFPNQNVNPTNPATTSTAITSTIGDNRDLQLALKVLF